MTLFNEFIVIQVSFSFLTTYPRSLYKPHAVQFSLFIKLVSTLNLYTLHRNSLKIKTMVSMCKKHLFLGTKAIFLSFLILAASATLVVAARASNLMEPKTGSNDTDFSKYNRPIEPSGPNPCSYTRGPGHCQPPKWYFMVHSIPYSMWYVIFLKKKKKNLACL